MKKIEDYIHLYIGCDVLVEINPDATQQVAKIIGVHIDKWVDGNYHPTIEVDFGYQTNRTHYYQNQIKLLLRPLSSMTEEEAKELIQFEKLNREYANVDFNIITGYKGNIVAIEVNYTIVDEDIVLPKVWTFNFCAMNSDDFRHLLSKGFDIFGLIDANLALDATKIEKV